MIRRRHVVDYKQRRRQKTTTTTIHLYICPHYITLHTVLHNRVCVSEWVTTSDAAAAAAVALVVGHRALAAASNQRQTVASSDANSNNVSNNSNDNNNTDNNNTGSNNNRQLRLARILTYNSRPLLPLATADHLSWRFYWVISSLYRERNMIASSILKG